MSGQSIGHCGHASSHSQASTGPSGWRGLSPPMSLYQGNGDFSTAAYKRIRLATRGRRLRSVSIDINNVCASAVRVVKCSDRQCTDGLRTRLRWFPAHQGCYFGSTSPNRNETANAAARGLTRRVVAPASLVLAEGVATDDEDDEEEAELVTSYADVLEWYRSARRSMPDLRPQLTREQAVLYRQLQTNSVLTPELARFICPDVYESAKCSVCNSATATLTHVLWDCKLNPEEAAAYPGRLPTDIASAVTAQDSEQQLQAVQRIETALARQTRRDAPDGIQGRQPRGERWVPRRKRRDAT
ncbi:hypothetical protein HPB49_007298 [Dermacentor silvarum]|uniref:Uncharacterized protein n=1 Tax=Dermacentor silvarum TaxID=543639 RepID=A0ACB8D3J7_DERSI|nr:hypothetical protein HPB49_007298 [Dermacentor silvarum]